MKKPKIKPQPPKVDRETVEKKAQALARALFDMKPQPRQSKKERELKPWKNLCTITYIIPIEFNTEKGPTIQFGLLSRASYLMTRSGLLALD